MRFAKNFSAVLYLSLLAAGCAAPQKKHKQNLVSPDQIEKIEQAFSLLKNKKFLKGALIYDDLAESLKDRKTKALMLFNAAGAYKEAGLCDKALKRLRRLLDQSLESPSFKSRALMEISYAYECLGDRESELLSLQSAEKLRSHMPWTLKLTVLPARLAAAYAGFGKRKKAKNLQNLSLKRMLQLKTAFSSEKALNQTAGRLFYLMGRSYIKKEKIQPEAFFKTFPYRLFYLLQSLVIQNKPWSKEAQRETSLLFDKLYAALKQSKDKKQYKKQLLADIESGRIFVKKENVKKIEDFYSQTSKPVLKFLLQSP